MKRYELSATDLRQYEALTDAEREAWNHPLPNSYHSFHVERMGADTFRWRDSQEAVFYVGTVTELLGALCNSLRMRRLDPNYQNHVQTLRILSQTEVDDLLADL